MPDFYYSKIIYNYRDFEYFEYQRPVITHKPRKKYQKKIFKTKTKSNNYRAKSEIRRIISCNIDNSSKFYTLTFADNITDLSIANIYFRNFIKKLKYHYGKFFYISVPEFQQRGAVHYHVIANLPFIPQQVSQDLWANGWLFVQRPTDTSVLPGYLTKYITKAIEDPRYFGKKKYFTSRGCLRPIVYYDYNRQDVIDSFAKTTLRYTKKMDSKYYGKVDYFHYLTSD